MVTSTELNNGTVLYDMRRAPELKTKWRSIKDGIYNRKNGTVLGKTGRQWGITGTFYLVFFTVLALLFAICMMGLNATIDDNVPKYTLDQSLIGSNPGLGFRPLSDDKRASLIWYQAHNTTQIDFWVKKIDDFLEGYVNRSALPNGGVNQQICSYNQTYIKKNNVCEFDVKSLGPCAPGDGYGFNNSAPCIFIKLNKIFDWIPDYYNDVNDLPKEMPEDLKNKIRSLNHSAELNTVWLSCGGEHDVDVPHVGELEYFPSEIRGFPGYFYPYKNLPGYLSPLVAVKFSRPELNQIINIDCHAWAKNIKHNRKDKLGMVHFELRIDGLQN